MKNQVAVATYNMSYMSALGFPEDDPLRQTRASEATFLAQNTTPDQRLFWKNALNLLMDFIETNHNKEFTCVIGLQEILGPEKIAQTKVYRNTIDKKKTKIYAEGPEFEGYAEINERLNKFNETNNTEYIQVVNEIFAFDDNIGLSIIYDKKRFGDVQEIKYEQANKYKNKKYTDSHLKKHEEHQGTIFDNDSQPGRPILIVVTKNNSVFITAHGAQDGKLIENILKKNEINNKDKATEIYKQFNANTKKSQQYIQDTVNTFLETQELNPTDIFLMADLNDRFDEIKEFEIGKKYLLYNGDAPKSCCYNWDSSCSDERYKELMKNTGYCSLPDANEITAWDKKLQMQKKLQMHDEGKKENYRYRGDKVFGRLPASDMMIFDNTNKSSKESDHQMVYALFDACFDEKGKNNNVCGVRGLIKKFEPTAEDETPPEGEPPAIGGRRPRHRKTHSKHPRKTLKKNKKNKRNARKTKHKKARKTKRRL